MNVRLLYDEQNRDFSVIIIKQITIFAPCKRGLYIYQKKARIVKIDVDTHEELAVKYRIQAVPTFILFKKGEAVWRHSGMIQASELKGVIEQYT